MTSPALADALLKVREVARAIRKGRTTTYTLIMSGAIPSVRIGGSRFVRKSDLDRYIASLEPDLGNNHTPAGAEEDDPPAKSA